MSTTTPAAANNSTKRYRLRATVTEKQLRACVLDTAAERYGLRDESFELDDIRPGFGSVFPKQVPRGTVSNSRSDMLNGYRVPLMFCKIARAEGRIDA